MLNLNTVTALISGKNFTMPDLLGHLNPVFGSYTSIYSAPDCCPPLIGQMHYTAGSRSAHLTALMPDDSLDTPDLNLLLEDLARQAGEWGAFHLLAEVEEHSPALDFLRQVGFGVIAWERIFQFDLPQSSKNCKPVLWRTASAMDENAIRNLFGELVPMLVQVSEPFVSVRSPARVYVQDGAVMAYIEVRSGSRGLYLNPLIHPEVRNVNDLIEDLIRNEPRRTNQPVYFAVRSYLGWLETCMEDQQGKASERYAVMVKHLATLQRGAQTKPAQAMLEKYKVEPTAPIVNSSAHPVQTWAESGK